MSKISVDHTLNTDLVKLNIVDNNIYVCTVTDLEFLDEYIIKNRIVNGEYYFKNLSKKGYMWYNKDDMDFERIEELYFTLNTRDHNCLTGTYYNGETNDKDILEIVNKLLKKNYTSLESDHNIPILFYLHERIDITKNLEFYNKSIFKKNVIYDVKNNNKYIGKVVISKTLVANSGYQAGITFPVSHTYSQQDNIYYNGFGNYNIKTKKDKKELEKYFNDNNKKIKKIIYYTHTNIDEYINEYDSNKIYVFDDHKFIKSILKTENYIKKQQSDGTYLESKYTYANSLSNYVHYLTCSKIDFLEKVYKKYNINISFDNFDIINNSIEVDDKYDISSVESNIISVLNILCSPNCSTEDFIKIEESFNSFYKHNNQLIYINFNIQLIFKDKNKKYYYEDSKLKINEDNIIKNEYVTKCFEFIKSMSSENLILIHCFINNSFVCLFHHNDNKINKYKIEIERISDYNSIECFSKTTELYPYHLKVILYK